MAAVDGGTLLLTEGTTLPVALFVDSCQATPYIQLSLCAVNYKQKSQNSNQMSTNFTINGCVLNPIRISWCANIPGKVLN
jgi:hypothetical protein